MLPWREYLVRKKKDRDANCWISPDGDWYNVLSAQHQEFAKKVVEELYPTDYTDDWKTLREFGTTLIKYGWVYVEDNVWTGTIVRGKMNMIQYRALKSFWKDTLLFRGWTIDSIFAESLREKE